MSTKQTETCRDSAQGQGEASLGAGAGVSLHCPSVQSRGRVQRMSRGPAKRGNVNHSDSDKPLAGGGQGPPGIARPDMAWTGNVARRAAPSLQHQLGTATSRAGIIRGWARPRGGERVWGSVPWGSHHPRAGMT